MESIPRAHKSVIDKRMVCHHCGSEVDLQSHHMLKGVAYRWKAEQDGLFVMLCASCHAFLHGKDGHALDLQYKQEAERAWLEHYHKTIPDFIARYGKNYLD